MIDLEALAKWAESVLETEAVSVQTREQAERDDK